MWNEEIIERGFGKEIRIASKFTWDGKELIDQREWVKGKPWKSGWSMPRERIVSEYLPKLMKVLGIKEWKAPVEE